ncbi:hypothetical protein TcWFU_001511 [Taenia crassiceps]|uniref:Uncharacterized protein n=1 Tax=Taenia crassiceps TaxID=6207 RepID=A0ABR4QL58_9CEST
MSRHSHQNGQSSDPRLEFSSHQGQSSDERILQTLYPETSGLIEQVRDIKRRLSEATAKLSPTIYPIATRDVLTAVSLGRYEAAQHFLSSTQSVSNNGAKCIHSQCHCCAGVLSFLAYLISTNSYFEQPRWSELRKILHDQRPAEPSFCCPDVENALKELVSVSCELAVSTVPLDEMQEMERRLQAVDAEVVHLQNQMQNLQKLLDDVHSESNWRQSAVSEELTANSMKTSSIVAWLDLATSCPTSDTESELRRQTNNSSRQANEQELDLRAKITALIADKEVELAELRRGAVKWASKHTLIRNKQAEIKELTGVLSNELAQIPDISEADTLIGLPKLHIPSSKDLIGHIQSLRNDLAVFFQSFEQADAQRLLPSLTSLSDTLAGTFAHIRPFTESAEKPTNFTNLDDAAGKMAAQMDYLRYQQLEVGCADYGLNESLTVRVRQPTKATRSGDEDIQVIDEFVSSPLPTTISRHTPPKQALSSQDQKIGQWGDEIRDENSEVEHLKLVVTSLKQEVNNNKEALQLLCESRLALLERVGALTGGDECGDSFADFVSKLRQINSPDEHLKTLNTCDDLLTQRLMDWSRKCQEGGKSALKQKEVEMKHLLARLEEEEELLKIHSDEADELHAQMKLLKQPLSSDSYDAKEEWTESVPLLQEFEESIHLTQAIPLRNTLSADLDEFQPFKGVVGGVRQTSHEARLQSKIDDQVAAISRLEARLCEQNETFRAKLAEADEKTSQFNTIQCAYERDVQQLSAVLRQKIREVSQLQQMLSSKKQEISGLTGKIRMFKSESELLQEELKFAQEESVMRSLEVENLQGALNEKTDELSAIREVMTDHETQMRNLHFVLNNKDVDLRERDRQIEALLNKLAVSKADFEAVRKDFDQLNTTFDRLWKSTLLMHDCADSSGNLPAVKHEPMLVLKSSSAVDQFLSLLSSKESETVICDVQASVKAYKAFQEKAKEQRHEQNALPTIIRDDPDLPWNPCCVTAVSAISAITGDAKVFNLIRDLAYSESCRVRLTNRLSNVESQKDQLKGMLSALQAEVESNHVQLAERNRQLILLGIDPNDTTVSLPSKRKKGRKNIPTKHMEKEEEEFKQEYGKADMQSKVEELQSELDGERAKVSKLAEDLAAREAEKDALSRSCEEMTGELEKKESERKLLEERMKEVVGARSEEVEVAAVEMEGLRQRVHDLEEEKSRKTEECERLLRDVEVLRDELNEAKARETAATSASMLPVVEPSVVEAVKAEPLLSSVPPVLMEEAPVVVDVCHGYVEEKSAPAVDEGLLVARLSALAEQVSTTSSLQAEVRNSWLVLMEQAESGVASLVRDQVELKARLGELEADVKSLSAEVREKGARVEALTREVVDKEEELERRECSLRELEASMTEVSTRLLSQLEDLMSAVNSGEGRVSELMSMVDEVGAREGELRDQVMEKVSRERQLQSELDGERAKVSKLAEDLAAREAEKDALSRSCEEMTGELEKKESERKLLEERMKEVVGARSEEVEVAAVEMEGLRQRVHDLEEEKSRKTEECERLLRDVEVLRDELNEAKARETAATSASMLPVMEPSVVEAVKAEPLLSSVPPVLMEEAPVVVDVCHGYVEEKSAPAVDEGLLVARLSALAEQVSTTSSLQAEVRNSWLVLMEQAESGVASLVRDQVELKARLGELEADVKSLSAEVRRKVLVWKR